MGISFPKRPQRSTFGPKLVNNYPAENPNSDVPDVALNGMFSTVAGCALLLPRANCIALYAGGLFVVGYQAEAWNQDGNQAHPTLARSAAVRYSYLFAATYLDEDGVAVATDIKGARVSCPSDSSSTTLAEGFAWIDPTNPLKVLMRVGTRVASTGVFSNADVAFWLAVM